MNEDDQYQDGDVPEIRITLPAGTRNYMTPEGAQRLQADLHGMANVERPKLAAAVARLTSAETGGAADDLKRQRWRLRKLDRRIEYLNRMLAMLEVVDPTEQDSDRVVFGATVTVAGERDEQRTYQIVGVDESDPEQGRISWISPVAKALIGARRDEQVTVTLPGGESKLRVCRIEYH